MKLKSMLIGTIVAVVIGMSLAAGAEFNVSKVGDSVVDAEALTIKGGFGQCINGLSFQQDAVVTHAGYQYVSYYDGKRRLCLTRRMLPAGDWETIRFTDYDFFQSRITSFAVALLWMCKSPAQPIEGSLRPSSERNFPRFCTASMKR